MAEIVTIAGSPMERSRTTALLAYVGRELEAAGLSVHAIQVRQLPAEDLLFGRYESPAVLAVAAEIALARGVVLATPVYKAAYSGVLKALLDLLSKEHAMDSRYRPQPIHGQAPDHMDYYWLALWPPDGLYVLPPDPAAQPAAEGEDQGELLLLVGLLLVVGFLAAAIILSAAVS